MPILKPCSALKSWSRKLSQRQSVRLPWAIVVPNGLSLFARSTSTWIHWWSLGPMVCPIRAFSSSIPFTMVGVLMTWSLPVVVPRLCLQCLLQGFPALSEDRLPVRWKDGIEAKLEEWLQRWVEALPVEALHFGVDL